MFMSENPQQESAIDFYTPATNRREQPHQSSSNMLIHLAPQPHHLPAASSSSGDDTSANHNSSNPPSLIGPKKRADTWIQEETRTLISLRKEVHTMFNTSKSNKHLWDNISMKMRERGFDRSPTMCTDKWRNLLKKFKKAKHSNPDGVHGSGRMSFFKEIVEILGEGNMNGPGRKISEILNIDAGAGASKVDSFMQFADKGIDDASLPLGSVDANVRSTLNLERHLDHDGLPLSIAPADTIGANGVSPWNWRETPGSVLAGEQANMAGRVITVKLGDYTKKIGIDASANSIKEAIKSAFRLRTRRAFWLEDEDNVVRSLGKDMPLGNYTLHVDEGLSIKVCVYGETDVLPVHTEGRTFYSDEDFRHFLKSRGWVSLREYNGFRSIDSMDELCPGAIYRGVS